MATALANNVFPVPGGPYNKMPLGGLTPRFLNICGFFNGHSTASIKLCLISSIPPISSHLTLGTSTKTSLNALGLTTFKASLKALIFIINFSKISFSMGSSFLNLKSGNNLLKTIIADSLHKASRSAPTKPCVILAISSNLTSLAKGISLV